MSDILELWAKAVKHSPPMAEDVEAFASALREKDLARIAELEEALNYVKDQCLNIPSKHIYDAANTALSNKEVTK